MSRRGLLLTPGLILIIYTICWTFPKSFFSSEIFFNSNATDFVKERTLLKPRVFFRTFANSLFARAKKRILEEANGTGWFTSMEGFGPKDLPPKFIKVYKDVLSLDCGGGYWIWKIAVIEMAMDLMDEGDLLIYADAGCKINKEGPVIF
jgi:hypothetical protein